MERKNTILLTVIAVATLLVAVVGATFAYFTASVQDSRTDSGNTNLTTGQISSSTIVANVDNAAGNFNATDIYPGHKEVAALSVSANGDAGSKTGVTFTYNVTQNGLGQGNVTVKLYKSTTKVETGTTGNYFQCNKQIDTENNETRYSEQCNVTETGLGTLVGSAQTLTGGAQTVTLGSDTITVDVKDVNKTVYYYVVVEFVNKDENQNAAMNTTLTGQVTVSASAV